MNKHILSFYLFFCLFLFLPLVEAIAGWNSFIVNFDKSVYGEKVIVKWYKFLREMVKFDSVEELIDQLNKDKRDTEVFFGDLKKN